MTATDLYNDLVLHGFSLSVQGGNLILSPSSQLSQTQRLEIKQHKSELLLLLAANESYSPLEDGQQQPPFSLNNYSHCVTCNQCEHLALTGTCSRLGKRVNPQALRECGSFQLLKSERTPLTKVKPYSQDELNRLLNQAARPLYHHLIDCQQCSLEDARYCSDGMTLGNRFDDLLLCFDDAANKRYLLMNQVIKARVSGRRAFESLSSDNAPQLMQTALQTRKFGNSPQDEAFINHWTACEVCKPSLGRYCSEGQRLEKEANC